MVTLLTLLAALVLVGGGALVFYVSSLAKTAYDLKVQLQADLDAGLKKIEDEAVKNSRWLKRDLVEDIEKSKTAIQTDNARRFNEAGAALEKQLAERDERFAAEHAELVKTIEILRKDLHALGQGVLAIKKQVPGEVAAVAAALAPIAGAAPVSRPFQPESLDVRPDA